MRYRKGVSTTLPLADDVVEAARAIAARDGRSPGEVVSELARESLDRREPRMTTRNGLPIFASRGRPGSITLDLVNRLRDEAP